MRLCLLYLLNSRAIPHLTFQVPVKLSSVSKHNILFLILSITCKHSYLSLSLPTYPSVLLAFSTYLLSLFSTIPFFIPGIYVTMTCCFPLPLILLIAFQQPAFHLKGWLVLAAVQVSGALSGGFATCQTSTFKVMHSVFFTLWVVGTMSLFQSLTPVPHPCRALLILHVSSSVLYIPISLEGPRTLPYLSEDFSPFETHLWPLIS